jgi:hypothetical protein
MPATVGECGRRRPGQVTTEPFDATAFGSHHDVIESVSAGQAALKSYR